MAEGDESKAALIQWMREKTSHRTTITTGMTKPRKFLASKSILLAMAMSYLFNKIPMKHKNLIDAVAKPVLSEAKELS